VDVPGCFVFLVRRRVAKGVERILQRDLKTPKLKRLDLYWCVGVPLDKMAVDKDEREGGTSTSLKLVRDGRIIQKYV
jgi:hypothetical protein